MVGNAHRQVPRSVYLSLRLYFHIIFVIITKRYFRRKTVKLETIFGRDCYGVDRSDSLIIIQRTEEVHRLDGSYSIDVHEDCYCSDKTNCRHFEEDDNLRNMSTL